MSAPLRIASHPSDIGGGPGGDPLKDYLARLVKLIPGEIVALYLAGKVAIESRFATPPKEIQF